MSPTRDSLSLRSGESAGVRGAFGLALILLAACEGTPSALDAGEDAGVVDAGPTLTAFQQGLLTAHDGVRANAMPVPSPALPAMRWSPSAQALAEEWASRCNFMHRDPNTLGENLSAATREFTPAEVVGLWAGERVDYTYATDTCRLGKACGHYTQIVWRSSVGLGCAQQRCTTGNPLGSGAWFFFVCNYDPPGNYLGQKPY
ncbi:MAG: CAP domain-containing protein [Archangium sp.]|nr:CAP domain-containing protein [Archangium sp.]